MNQLLRHHLKFEAMGNFFTYDPLIWENYLTYYRINYFCEAAAAKNVASMFLGVKYGEDEMIERC